MGRGRIEAGTLRWVPLDDLLWLRSNPQLLGTPSLQRQALGSDRWQVLRVPASYLSSRTVYS